MNEIAAIFILSILLFFGLLAYLTVGVVSLKKRVRELEQRLVRARAAEPTRQWPEPYDSDKQTYTAVPESDAVEQELEIAVTLKPAVQNGDESAAEVPPDRGQGWAEELAGSLSGQQHAFGQMLKNFLTGGNLVLKGGLVVLFFGVAFLIKYAAERDLMSIELRLIFAALGGVTLLLLGWRLRHRTLGYGLGLQGGGIGVLYLVVYGAAKLYYLLPLPISLLVMIGLVVLCGVLAVLQDSRMLAISGILGGFLAPILMSTGSGNHLLLFSYYSLLNLGILGISWYRAWRELNLLGFFFTFMIAAYWGNTVYRPEFFASTEPFLILSFLFYVAISVLFAHRQPLHLRGFVDGPLVFGLPLVVISLQHGLIADMRYGMALSCFCMGIFYLGLAALLWRKLPPGMRTLCEAFLALGVVFLSLTVPLVLDDFWTSATWALEGAAMVWIGVRQRRTLARLFALVLQFGAAWIFIESVFYPFGAIPFANSYFLGCLLIAASALFSSMYLEKYTDVLRDYEKHLPLPLFIWGMCWWYYGGIREAEHNFIYITEIDSILLFASATTMLMVIVADKFSWLRLHIGQMVLLPILWLSLIGGILIQGSSSHLFAELGILAWLIALFTQYRLMHHCDNFWPERLAGIWHCAALWLVVVLTCEEMSWLLRQVLHLSDTWEIVCWLVLPATVIFVLVRWGTRLSWPVAAFSESYFGLGIAILGIALMGLSLYGLTMAGNPAPLPFVPIFNPLELALAWVIVCLGLWVHGGDTGRLQLSQLVPAKMLYWLLGGLAFLWINGIVARCLHFYGGVPYTLPGLYGSVVMQTAVAALWSCIALSVTVMATRLGNRELWCCGAGLLALVVLKLFVIDLSGSGTVARIISFLVVGILMLVIGYFSPIPPSGQKEGAT